MHLQRAAPADEQHGLDRPSPRRGDRDYGIDLGLRAFRNAAAVAASRTSPGFRRYLSNERLADLVIGAEHR